MFDRYSLSRRQARICRIAAILFAITAALRVVAIAVPLMLGSPAGQVKCGPAGCLAADRPDLLLPEEERAGVIASPAAAAKLATYAWRRDVRAGLTAIDAASAAPFVALMLCVAAATWRLGARSENDLARALPWLRRASIAAVAAALVPPVTDSLRAMLLFPATPEGPMWYLAIDGGRFAMDLLLAFAAFIVCWAIEAGSRARTEIAGFI